MLAAVHTNTILLYMTQSVLSASKVLNLMAHLLCVVQSSPLLEFRAICLLRPHISLTNIRLQRRLELCFLSSAACFHSFLNLERLNGADRLLLCTVNGR